MVLLTRKQAQNFQLHSLNSEIHNQYHNDKPSDRIPSQFSLTTHFLNEGTSSYLWLFTLRLRRLHIPVPEPAK